MQSKAEFYLADTSEINPKTGGIKVTPNVLHFALKRPHYSDPEKIDTLYDNVARPEHVENYGSAFGTFMQEHPSFVLPWAPAPQSEPVPEIPVIADTHSVKPKHHKKLVD